MPRGALNAVARHLRHLAGVPADALTDAELLRRFVAERDEAAFAGLVERHGPLVWAVCRRSLRRPEDAEDAFQATFLVLARKAASIREAGKVSSWLYGVAYRTAMRTKQTAAKQRRQERRAPARAPDQPVTEAALHELQALLDEEVQRLPAKYRCPFVLCCLEGRSRAEAARELGWKEGTVAGRVAEARERLRLRLARRGIVLAAALCAVEVGRGAASALPPIVAAAGRGAPSARAAALAQGVIRAMFATQLKGGAVMLVALGLLAAGTAAAARQAFAAPQAVAQQAGGAPRPTVEPEQSQHAGEPAPTDRYGDPLPAGAVARLGTVRFWHGSQATKVAFSPDGKVLASAGGGRDGVVIWDPHIGRPLHRLRWPHIGLALTFSPDGRLLYEAGSCTLFDVATGKELRQFETPPITYGCAAFAPDGRTIACGEWSATARVVLRDVATGAEIRHFAGHSSDVVAVAFSPDGRRLASGSADRTVRFWDTATGKERFQLKGHQDEVYTVAFSPDGAVLTSAGKDSVIRLWDSATGKELRRLTGHEGAVLSVAFAPGGKVLATGGRDGTIRLWDVSTGREVRRWTAHHRGVHSLSFGPDGTTLASAGALDAIRLWEVATGQEIRPAAGHTGVVRLLRFAPDGGELVSRGWDGNLLVWDVASGRERRRLFGGPPSRLGTGVALSQDGKVLALEEAWTALGKKTDTVIRLRDTATGKELHTLAVAADREMALAFSPGGKRLASGGSDSVVRLWDVTTGKELYQRKSGRGGVWAVVFSPDGRWLATGGGDDHTIRLWEADTGKEVRHWQAGSGGPIRPLVFSPDGRLLAGSDTGTVRVWDTEMAKELWSFAGTCYALAFSPTGRTLAIQETKDKRLDNGRLITEFCTHLREVASGQEIQHFDTPQGTVWSLAFAPDERTLASGGDDSTILVRDLTGRLKNGRLPHARFTPKELDWLWTDLGAEAAKAYPAVWALTAAPDQAVPLLRERLRPARRPDPQRLARLIADLDSDQFSVRDKAARQLDGLGEMAGPALRDALAGHASPELRRRAEVLLDRTDLRPLRTVAVLEQVGTPEAKEVLRAWPQGAPESRLTREAKASLDRLVQRPTLP
jgi:RNA polymerase sigma factor (sigma-70 family)